MKVIFYVHIFELPGKAIIYRLYFFLENVDYLLKNMIACHGVTSSN